MEQPRRELVVDVLERPGNGSGARLVHVLPPRVYLRRRHHPLDTRPLVRHRRRAAAESTFREEEAPRERSRYSRRLPRAPTLPLPVVRSEERDELATNARETAAPQRQRNTRGSGCGGGAVRRICRALEKSRVNGVVVIRVLCLCV